MMNSTNNETDTKTNNRPNIETINKTGNMTECSEDVILIVDDNLNNLNVLSDILENRGFEVLAARDGESALKSARLGQPDLILLDIMMPGMDGYETLKQLKQDEATAGIPVIFITALSETESKVNGFEIGAVDYVTKPIQPDEVISRVRTHLTIRKLQKDLSRKNNELEEMLDREKELSKLRSQLIALASHDLRTPLTVITFACTGMLHHSNCGKDKSVIKNIERIRKATDQVESFLKEMMMLSKTEARKYQLFPEFVSVGTFCKEIAEEFRGICQDTHSIVTRTPEQELSAQLDPKVLRHILSNLVSNAIKYSPSKSDITLSCDILDDNVVFRISDKGIGISPEDRDKLFNSFQRGENVGEVKGEGLGLAIARQLAVLHGGDIVVDSVEGKGSTFSLLLPYLPPKVS